MTRESVNTSLLRTLNPAEIAWIWSARVKQRGMRCGRLSGTKVTRAGSGMPLITHRQGLGLRLWLPQREVFVQLKALWEPFGLTRSYTDYWDAYTRHLDSAIHSPGKRTTQQIERKHLTLRTRIKRLVLCQR